MKKRNLVEFLLAVGLALGVSTAAAAGFPANPVARCAPDAVRASQKAGPLAIHAFVPLHSAGFIGFRCAR